MKKPPYTTRRGNIWQYLRRVSPKSLIPILGFAEYRESLHTPDIETARIRAAIRNAVVEVELQAARAELKRQQGNSPPVTTNLSPESLRFIREAVLAHTLQVGVDPISRTPYCSKIRSPRCPNRIPQSRRTRRTFESNWSSSSKPGATPMNWPGNLAATSPASYHRHANLRAVLREPPWGADGQTARAMLRSKQAPRVGGGKHKMHGEAGD